MDRSKDQVLKTVLTAPAGYHQIVNQLRLSLIASLALLALSSAVNFVAIQDPATYYHADSRGSVPIALIALVAASYFLRGGIAWLPVGMIAAGSLSNALWIEFYGAAPDWLVIAPLGIIANFADLLIGGGLALLILITLSRAAQSALNRRASTDLS